MTPEQLQVEVNKCLLDPAYFIRNYVQILSGENRDWVPFGLWGEQERTLRTIHASKLTVILKARQLGLSWLCLGYALWQFMNQPGSLILLFSRRDDEAVDLLKRRFVGMYQRLPEWMRSDPVVTSNDHEFATSSGSLIKAFPVTGGDSYTANLAIVDEADLIPDLGDLLASVKPTIDAPGNKLVLLSRVDKAVPEHPKKLSFKRIYRMAKEGKNSYTPVFLPWHVRPDRGAAWYEEQKRDSLANTGSLDYLYGEYPATDAEALAPNMLDKRFPAEWLNRVFEGRDPLPDPPLYLPGLRVFALPDPEAQYVIGSDVAGGAPHSHDSTAVVMDALSGEEVANLAGKIEPSVLAEYLARLSEFYNGAAVMVEQNNYHGGTALNELRNYPHVRRLCGPNGEVGWNTTTKSKALMYDIAVEAVRQRDCVIHDLATYHQLASVDGGLKAPDQGGEHGDLAVAFALACVGRVKVSHGALPVIRPLQFAPRPSLFGGANSQVVERGALRVKQAGRRDGLPERSRPSGLFGR